MPGARAASRDTSVIASCPKKASSGVLPQTTRSLFGSALSSSTHATGHAVNHGPVIVSPSGLARLSPYLVIVDRAPEQMVRLLTKFGMTPSKRSRVSKVKPEKPQVNPRAAFLTRVKL